MEIPHSGVRNRRWILEFDNAENPTVIRDFLPTGIQTTEYVDLLEKNSAWRVPRVRAFGYPIKLNQAIREINRYSLAKIDHNRTAWSRQSFGINSITHSGKTCATQSI